MTILSSKKPTNNNNRDATTTQQPASQQQQQQQQQTQQPPSQPTPVAVPTRTRPSRDDEHSNSPLTLTDENNETNDVSSSSLNTTATNNVHSMPITTTSSVFTNNSKRKSQYHHNHHFNPTIGKQTRRRRPSIGENSSSNDENHPSSSSRITTHQNSDDNDQYNSEDEYEQRTIKYDRNNLNEHEMHFARALKEKKGFIIKPVQEDGACLFRAVSDQVFGDEEMHSTVRENCMDYIVKNADFFRAYITEDFDRYITRKRRQNCHGNHIEMIALSELYNRPIEVYEYSIEPINIVHGMYKTDNEPIRLSYHCGVHYNSIVDPWRPTAGHGLGLPDLQPGRAQESLLNTALRQSEDSHLERTMLDDKLAATDWEATQDELIQQIARESYLQWLCENSQSKKEEKTTVETNSSETTSNSNEACSSHQTLPLRLDERKDCEFALPFHYEGETTNYGDDDDDDESLMRQVLAMSQIEYVETLRKQQEQAPNSSDPDQPSSSSNTDFL